MKKKSFLQKNYSWTLPLSFLFLNLFSIEAVINIESGIIDLFFAIRGVMACFLLVLYFESIKAMAEVI